MIRNKENNKFYNILLGSKCVMESNVYSKVNILFVLNICIYFTPFDINTNVRVSKTISIFLKYGILSNKKLI